MTLVWHLLRADVRKHRVFLLAWVTLVTTGAIAAVVLPLLAVGRGQTEAIAIAKTLYGVSGVLLGTLIVAQVIHAHSPVGSQAFWLTRPIPLWAVLSAKALLLVGVIVVLPMAAEAARMSAADMPVPKIVQVAFWFGAVQMLWLALAAAPAAITGTLPRYALLVVCGVAAVTTFIAIATAVQFARMEEVAFVVASRTASTDGGLLFMVLTWLAGVAVVTTQFVTRSRAWSIASGLTLLAAAVLASYTWPWSYFALQPRAAAWADQTRPAVVADPDSARTTGEFWSARHETNWRQVSAHVRVTGVEPGWVVHTQILEANATLPSGDVVLSAAGSTGIPPIEGREGDPVSGAVRTALGVSRLFEPVAARADQQVVLSLREREQARVAGAIASYRARIELTPERYSVETVLPLQVGAEGGRGSYRLVVADVQRADTLRLLVWSANAGLTSGGYPAYYLRHRSRGEAVEGSADLLVEGFTAPFGFELSGFSNQRLRLIFPKVTRSQPGTPPAFALDQSWLRDAELVVVSVSHAASVERVLAVDGFRIPPPEVTLEPATNLDAAGPH